MTDPDGEFLLNLFEFNKHRHKHGSDFEEDIMRELIREEVSQ